MTKAVEYAMKNSCLDFVDIVWPRLGPKIGGGRLIPAETVNQEFARLLDTVSGIDAFQVLDNNMGIRGIASRVQWGPTAWNTYTIRARTRYGVNCELLKKSEQIRNGEYLFPFYTTQAYINTMHGVLLSAAAIKTIDLYRSVEVAKEEWKERVNPADGNLFIYASWSILDSRGFRSVYV